VNAALSVKGLRSTIGELEILKGVDLEVPFGEVHALMGPNGSGKSTLCHTLMGKPEYFASGSATVDGVELLGTPVDQRSAAGLFQTFQYPVEIAGVTLSELLAEIADASGNGSADRGRDAVVQLEMTEFLDRWVNQGLSGGEKKKSEIVQLLARRPKVALLDEIDSGLDIDAVREVAAAVEGLRDPERGVLIITHYSRILRYLTIDKIHVMMAGRVVRVGGPELAQELETKGYDMLRGELGLEPAEEPVGEADPFP